MLTLEKIEQPKLPLHLRSREALLDILDSLDNPFAPSSVLRDQDEIYARKLRAEGYKVVKQGEVFMVVDGTGELPELIPVAQKIRHIVEQALKRFDRG